MKILDVCMVCSVSIIFRWPFGANSSPGTHPLGQDNIITLVLIIFSTFVTSMRTEPTFVGHYALYSQILQSVQQSFSQIGWCHVWLWHIVTWQDFEGGLEKIRHNTVTARHCHPLLLLHYILCFCSSSASAAALQLRFKLLLLLCFVYMVGSCVMYCPWLALV